MRHLNSEFITKYISEAGSKTSNKDYFGFVEMDQFACWAIAESYDNDNTIVSAQLAVETVINAFTKKPSLSKRKLKSFILEADRQLKMQSGNFKLKASILIVVTDYYRIRYISCGNCRLNAFRGSGIMVKSDDTSIYQEMIDSGSVPDDGENGIEESRNLTGYLGRKGKPKSTISKLIKLQNDDILLLSSWGFWNEITTIEMLDSLEGQKDAQNYIEELQDLYLSKQPRFVDNYTIATVFVNKVFQPKNNSKKIIKIIIIVSVIVLILFIFIFFLVWKSNKKRTEAIQAVSQYEQKGDIYSKDENYERALNEYTLGASASDALKGGFGKKGEENSLIKNNITLKQRITQLILDGDELFDQQNYQKAKENYEKSLKEAKSNLDFFESLDTLEIENKIVLCEEYEYTDSLIALADTQVALKDYENAALYYEEAKQLASKNNNKTALQTITLKIGEMQATIKKEQEETKTQEQEKAEEDKEVQLKGIEILELDGDMASAEGNYSVSLEYYNQVLNAYKELEEIEKASAVHKKILDTSNLMREEEREILLVEADTYLLNADDLMSENKYPEATEQYKKAKNIYIQTKATDKIQEITEKLNASQSAQKENEMAVKLREILAIEEKGDSSLVDKDYQGALEYYKQARALYQGINQLDKVLIIEDKIKTTEELKTTGGS